jgi:serine/threonine-protein kinase
MLGGIVGSYRILDRIAVGGMGTVYRAEHQLIGRIAAVKVLHPDMSGKRDIVNRFFNEAKATTQIKHPGIVEIFDFGYMPSGLAYLVMELLEGEPLSARMRERGKMPEAEAAVLMRGVCSALAAAHAKGIVHRDLKPENIFVVPDPESPMGVRTKLLDFGIAKLTDVGDAGSVTKTGAVMGTPTYMSPEQCKGTGEVDHRADLYSIGCMLYELVVGRPPFSNLGAGELLGSHLFVQPEPPSRHGPVSPTLERLIMRLLEKNPELRVQTALDLAGELAAIASAQGWGTMPGVDGRLSMAMIAQPPSRTLITPGEEVMPPPTPTTLSGTASESQAALPRRKGLVVAIGAGLLAAAVGITIVVASSGTSSTTHPGSQPAPSSPPPKADEVEPPPVEPPPVDPPKPVDTAAQPEPPPVDPPEATKPVDTETKPITKPITKPTKPTTKPTKPAPGGDLLENDID